jgi:phospholipid transport system substrate-binding protein
MPGIVLIGWKGDAMNLLGRLSLILLVLHLTALFSAAGDRGAVEVVENLHTTLLAVMKDGDQIGYKDRYDRLEPVIRASFDLPFISRTVLGRYWETLNQEQRSKFIETFSELSIATYAGNFDSYSGERFKTISEKGISGGRILVQTRLIKSDGGEIPLDYIFHRVDHQWRIINVIAEGVSDLALKRAEYSVFLKVKGFDALLMKLNEKIAQYSH